MITNKQAVTHTFVTNTAAHVVKFCNNIYWHFCRKHHISTDQALIVITHKCECTAIPVVKVSLNFLWTWLSFVGFCLQLHLKVVQFWYSYHIHTLQALVTFHIVVLWQSLFCETNLKGGAFLCFWHKGMGLCPIAMTIDNWQRKPFKWRDSCCRIKWWSVITPDNWSL